MTLPALRMDSATGVIYCTGTWKINYAKQIKQIIQTQALPVKKIIIDAAQIEALDSVGAWYLQKIFENIKHAGGEVQLQNFTPDQSSLLKLVSVQETELSAIPPVPKLNPLAKLGCLTISRLNHALLILSFIGEITFSVFRLLPHLNKIRWKALLGTMETTGLQALPIIALLSFLIGVVLTYQMGVQLRNYGANIYVVDFLGISILREFAPLITAIIIAGRTGSAFTAQIGTMKIREEIDALRTMGIDPNEILILPKITGLLFTLPLLTIWSSIFGIFGGMVMADVFLHIDYFDFLHRFGTAVSVASFTTGMVKTPIFGLIIASVGCFQGLQVSGSAESVGEHTTTSVVRAIFYIIVVDGIFSVIFSWLNI